MPNISWQNETRRPNLTEMYESELRLRPAHALAIWIWYRLSFCNLRRNASAKFQVAYVEHIYARITALVME